MSNPIVIKFYILHLEDIVEEVYIWKMKWQRFYPMLEHLAGQD